MYGLYEDETTSYYYPLVYEDIEEEGDDEGEIEERKRTTNQRKRDDSTLSCANITTLNAQHELKAGVTNPKIMVDISRVTNVYPIAIKS